MVSKVFLDINIVLDMLSPQRPNHKYHKKLLEKLSSCEVFISEDMISTIYYIAKEKRKVLDFFELVIQEWSIVPFGEKVIRESIRFARENDADLEDILQCFCAKEHGCEVLLTSDKKFVKCGIELQSYDEFVE